MSLIETLRRRFRLVAASALGIYWVALFVGTHIPLDEETMPGGSDKLLHFVAYAGLAYLLALWQSVRGPMTAGRYAAALGLLALYAPLDELLQGPVGRDPDIGDCLADWAGACAGLLALHLTSRVWNRMGRFPTRRDG